MYRSVFVLIGILLSILPCNVRAKIASGKVHLTGAKTESTLAKFAISQTAVAKIDLNITSYGMYEDEKSLRLRIYVDDEWRQVKRRQLCSEKVVLAQRAIPLVFDYKGNEPDDRKGKNPRRDRVEMYTARVQHEIDNPPNPHRKPVHKDRPRYFYFVVDDCSLEQYNHDAKIPDMIYDISIQNGRRPASGGIVWEHLPADEEGIRTLLVLTIFFSGALGLLLFYKMARTIGGGEVHVAICKYTFLVSFHIVSCPKTFEFVCQVSFLIYMLFLFGSCCNGSSVHEWSISTL